LLPFLFAPQTGVDRSGRSKIIRQPQSEAFWISNTAPHPTQDPRRIAGAARRGPLGLMADASTLGSRPAQNPAADPVPGMRGKPACSTRTGYAPCRLKPPGRAHRHAGDCQRLGRQATRLPPLSSFGSERPSAARGPLASCRGESPNQGRRASQNCDHRGRDEVGETVSIHGRRPLGQQRPVGQAIIVRHYRRGGRRNSYSALLGHVTCRG